MLGLAYESESGVSVVHPNPRLRRDGESEESFVARIAAKSVPEKAVAVVINLDNLPTSRTFRAAWSIQGRGVAVDMPKARAIHMERIRAARDALLVRLDGEALAAMDQERNADLAEIRTTKQTLRDLPQTLDLDKFKTPEELAAFWPDALDDTITTIRRSTGG